MSDYRTERAWEVLEEYRRIASPNGMVGDRIRALIVDLMCLAELHDYDPHELVADATAGYDEEDAVQDCGRDWAFESDQYTGYDRIHNDNRAEGRPTGKQWTSKGHDYSRGYKVIVP